LKANVTNNKISKRKTQFLTPTLSHFSVPLPLTVPLLCLYPRILLIFWFQGQVRRELSLLILKLHSRENGVVGEIMKWLENREWSVVGKHLEDSLFV